MSPVGISSPGVYVKQTKLMKKKGFNADGESSTRFLITVTRDVWEHPKDLVENGFTTVGEPTIGVCAVTRDVWEHPKDLAERFSLKSANQP